MEVLLLLLLLLLLVLYMLLLVSRRKVVLLLLLLLLLVLLLLKHGGAEVWLSKGGSGIKRLLPLVRQHGKGLGGASGHSSCERQKEMGEKTEG